MIARRNGYEQKLLKSSGAISAAALKKAILSIKPGVSELELDKIAREEIYRLGGDLSYKTVPDYNYATCITVNDQVVHGIPTNRKIKMGDLVSIDLASTYKGWHTDTAWTILVGKDLQKEKFIRAGEEALWQGVSQAVAGNRVGDISHAIQSKIESEGYSVVRSLVGHGVGKRLHEEPEIPGFGQKGTGPLLYFGMSLAIEVIYTEGKPDVILEKDGWTVSSADGSLGGLFEMTVIVGKGKPQILTDWRKI
ncbi:type I methionyl aminopeptidase [Candidatus Daviesbacteria bacterium]|nr:type I methionyl aminopeptidase [Candidatus Daviesbacteria bacterium]